MAISSLSISAGAISFEICDSSSRARWAISQWNSSCAAFVGSCLPLPGRLATTMLILCAQPLCRSKKSLRSWLKQALDPAWSSRRKLPTAASTCASLAAATAACAAHSASTAAAASAAARSSTAASAAIVSARVASSIASLAAAEVRLGSRAIRSAISAHNSEVVRNGPRPFGSWSELASASREYAVQRASSIDRISRFDCAPRCTASLRKP
mmetsp:Transcript_82350/g.266651  ORF Transcript_82350/g.266651 Transcript_82350/m.266651 type:complete len:212 (-) Transcript_82350:488-1123(-)